MEGTIIGGNIRCFLKLAGTEYMPDFSGKILLLEGLNSTSQQVATYLCQLRQMGAFNKINGILLGTFTRLDADIFVPSVEELVQKYAGRDIPVARTMDIGHGTDAKCILIGKHMEFR
jgi:muramoyltetrapeptide carboxypeptidase